MTNAPVSSSSEGARRSELTKEQARITERAGVVATGTLVSRALGLVRDQVIAAVFPRLATDAFFVAFTIPNVLRQLLAEGAVQSAVLPVLAETRQRSGDEGAREFYRTLSGLSLALLAAVTATGVVASPLLVDAFAGGYRQTPGQFERTVTLTRWVFPYIFFISSAALGVAALNTHGRFAATAFAPGLLNVSFIVAALSLPELLAAGQADPVLALAAGALVGGALQVVALWPSLRRIGYLGLPRFDFRHAGVRKVFRRMTPTLFGIGVYWIDVVLARHFLSEMDTGAQSYFSWAFRLCDFPQGIFVMAIQSAALPSLALLAAQDRRLELARTFAFGARLALFVGLAASVLLAVLAEPLVVLIFERGAFDAVSSLETARALRAQALAIWTVALVRQLVSVYYALGDTRTPVVVAALDLGVFVALALSLRGPFGHVGVSLAVAGSSAVQMALLFWGLRSKLPTLELGRLGRTAAKTLVAAGSAALGAWWAAALASEYAVASSTLGKLAPGLIALVAFASTFLVAARLLRSEELLVVTGALGRRGR